MCALDCRQGVPRHGCKIADTKRSDLSAFVTSGTMSAIFLNLDCCWDMSNLSFAKVGTEIFKQG